MSERRKLYIQVYIEHKFNTKSKRFYAVFNKHCAEIARFKYRTHAVNYVREYGA